MKITVTFKSPDAADYAGDELKELGANEDQLGVFEELCGEYFLYGEYCDIELDLEAGTATLVKA